jgi:hypothetical protein
MRKTHVLSLLLLVLLAFPLFGDGLGNFDLGFTLGTRSHFFEKDDTAKLAVNYGLTIGVSDVWEVDVTASSQLVPGFFADGGLQVMLQRSLLGFRNSGKNIAGMGYNMLAGFGVGFTTYNQYGKFYPTHLLFTLTPAAVGSPSLRKRERLLTLTLGINLYTQQFSLYLDIITDDFYVLGTYKDHPLPSPTASPAP